MPLSFFRRKKSEDQAPLTRAPERPQVEPLTVETPAYRRTPTDNRAPLSRRSVAAAHAADATARRAPPRAAARPLSPPAQLPPPPSRRPSRGRPSARRARPPQARRRTPPKRAPLPKAKRELLVSVDAGEKRVAVLEDDQVAEVYLERPERRSIAGNIYLGVVDNVLPGMEAAFVEIGLEKNGFLYVDEIVGPELEGRKGARKIQDLIQRGENVLVQAVKDPMKTKGARLTTEISLPGRFVVYVPHGEGLGVSRRLEDDERNRLKAVLKEHAPKQGGVIVRTAAEGASAEDIERDLDFLQRLWSSIEAKAKESTAPSLVYQEAELPLRVVRDLFTGDFERLLVDHDRTHKRIVGYLKKTSPHMAERVTRYKEREPLMEAFGVEQEIRSTLNRRVDLPSGGYLIFDYAEAFTVIDVNTGRFVGSRSKKSGATARGHDHEEQPRSGEGGRPPAAPARHRRDHRHRLHRHGEPEEPCGGRGGARRGARARPHEDLRRRDLAARPRRDDAPERHRRPARGHDEEVPDLRRRRDRRLRAHRGGRHRAPSALARHAGLARQGVQGRGRREGRVARRRARRLRACASSRRRRSAASSSSASRASTSTTSGCSTRARSRRSRRSSRSRSASRSRSSSARSACTTRTPAPARSRTSTSSSATPPSSSARRSPCASPPSPRASPGPSCSRRPSRPTSRSPPRPRPRSRPAPGASPARKKPTRPPTTTRRSRDGRRRATRTRPSRATRARGRARLPTRSPRPQRPASGGAPRRAEEADAPRHRAAGKQPQEEAGRAAAADATAASLAEPATPSPSRAAVEAEVEPAEAEPRRGARAEAPRRPPAGPVIHVPDRSLDGAEDGDDGDGAAPAKKRTRRGSRGGKNRRKKPAGARPAPSVATGRARG